MSTYLWRDGLLPIFQCLASSPACSSNIILGMCYAQNRFTPLLWDRMFTKVIVACIASTNGQGVTTFPKQTVSTFTNDLAPMWLAAWHRTAARKCAWNSTGRLDTRLQHSGSLLTFVLATPNTSKANSGKENRQERRQMDSPTIFKHDLCPAFYPTADIRPAPGSDAAYHWELTDFTTRGEETAHQNCLDSFQYQIGRCVSESLAKRLRLLPPDCWRTTSPLMDPRT